MIIIVNDINERRYYECHPFVFCNWIRKDNNHRQIGNVPHHTIMAYRHFCHLTSIIINNVRASANGKIHWMEFRKFAHCFFSLSPSSFCLSSVSFFFPTATTFVINDYVVHHKHIHN